MKKIVAAAFGMAGWGLLATAPASAQAYPPNVPVCLQVFDQGSNFIECKYASIPQCQTAASGRSAQCIVNPFFDPGFAPRARRGDVY